MKDNSGDIALESLSWFFKEHNKYQNNKKEDLINKLKTIELLGDDVNQARLYLKKFTNDLKVDEKIINNLQKQIDSWNEKKIFTELNKIINLYYSYLCEIEKQKVPDQLIENIDVYLKVKKMINDID